MSLFSIKFDGSSTPEVEGEFENVDQARDAAVRLLGEYLQENPEYAYNRHWRVDVRNHQGRLMLYVLVATVVAPPLPNLASYELEH